VVVEVAPLPSVPSFPATVTDNMNSFHLYVI
jgi:hypothetical protein